MEFIAKFVPLEAIATMCSADFLLLFMAVNIANVPLARDTGSRAWISGLAALSTAVDLIVLCIEVGENPMTRNHLWILAGAILASFAIARDDRLCTLQSRFESTMLFWAANKTTHRKPKG